MSQKGRNKVGTKEEKNPNWFPKLLLLFDEHWFFYNALFASQGEKPTSAMAGKLLRTPSLPPPGVDQGEEQVAENSDRKTRERRKLTYSSSLDSPQQSISSISTSSLSSSSTVRWVRLSETGELQGFKDLGLVFESREGVNSSSLVRAGPGQRVKEEEHEAVGNGRTRLYEARLIQWSAPTLDLRRLNRRSAEMKEDLRFWARAVACYIRREC